MSISAFISALLALISSMPKLLALAEALTNAANDWFVAYRRKQAEKQYDEATKKAKSTKDTSALDNVFKPN